MSSEITTENYFGYSSTFSSFILKVITLLENCSAKIACEQKKIVNCQKFVSLFLCYMITWSASLDNLMRIMAPYVIYLCDFSPVSSVNNFQCGNKAAYTSAYLVFQEISISIISLWFSQKYSTKLVIRFS